MTTSQLSTEGLVIFLFHGVIEKQTHAVRNYTRKHLPRDYFYNFLRRQNAEGTALSMEQIVDLVTLGKPFPAKSFAVTFDDGFENNYSIAAPVLADLGIPAMFYVTTDFIQSNSRSWIDRIEDGLENGRPVKLQLPWRKESVSPSSNADKIALLTEIRTYVKRDQSISPQKFADELCAQCGITTERGSDDPLDKKMSWDKVQELHRHSLFKIGGHTHTHEVMSFLSSKDLQNEVTTSMSLLTQYLGGAPRHYSYPEGLEHCFNDEVITLLKSHGVVCCPTAIPGVNSKGADLFHLRRELIT